MTIGNSANFHSEVIDFNGKVMVDFWAEWCGPCHMLSPILDEIANEKPDVKIVKVDADSESDLAAEHNINSLPTVLIFDKGKLVHTIVGFHQKQEYLQALL